MGEKEYKVELMLTIDDLKLLKESLKGILVRENSMNFKYLSKVAKLGEFIEEVVRREEED